jgi:hypothetical protein
MTEQKLTGWFPANAKPKRIGVYEVRSCIGPYTMYAYWNGRRFSYRCYTVINAYKTRGERTWAPKTAEWRGIAK